MKNTVDKCRPFVISVILDFTTAQASEDIESIILPWLSEVFPISNHEEASRRLIFYARMNNKDAVFAARDVDVLLLLS